MSDRTIVDLLRHGEPEGGPKIRGCGVDDPLSELGWRQMQGAVAGGTPWTRILSSPMRRCREFAEHLARDTGLPLAVDTDLREVGFGRWEGFSRHALGEREPGAWHAFEHDPVGKRPADAETLETFQARVMNALLGHLERFPGETTLVVCHGGVIRAVTAAALALPLTSLYRMQVDYAHLTRIALPHGAADAPPRLLWHNRPGLSR